MSITERKIVDIVASIKVMPSGLFNPEKHSRDSLKKLYVEIVKIFNLGK